MGKNLKIKVSVTVEIEGTYLITAQYSLSKGNLSANTLIKNTAQYLNVGENIVEIEFQANESRGSYGYWSPAYVDRTAQIQLFYLASEQELLDTITTNSDLDKKILVRF